MAKQDGGSKRWIAGVIFGAVAGAAYALWKTPMSGAELRSKLARGPVGQRDDVTSREDYTPGVTDKVISKIEHTIAPLVGVELGKTAPAANKPDTSPTVAEPVATALEGTGESIRAKRFAWGEPTPAAPAPTSPAEISKPLEPITPEPAVPVAKIIPEAPIVPKVKAVSNEADKETKEVYEATNYGTESIRAKRFSWGDPAPEAAQSRELPTPERLEPFVHETSQTGPIAEAIELEIEVEGAEEAAELHVPGTTTAPFRPVNASRMRQFPKLGGLED